MSTLLIRGYTMTLLTNGRLLQNAAYIKLNCFIVDKENLSDTPIYMLENNDDDSLELSKFLTLPAIAGSDFSESGAWSYYTIKLDNLIIKYNYQLLFNDKSINTNIYFEHNPKVLNNYLILSFNDNKLVNKLLTNGNIEYSKTINNKNDLDLHKKLLKVTKLI